MKSSQVLEKLKTMTSCVWFQGSKMTSILFVSPESLQYYGISAQRFHDCRSTQDGPETVQLAHGNVFRGNVGGNHEPGNTGVRKNRQLSSTR